LHSRANTKRAAAKETGLLESRVGDTTEESALRITSQTRNRQARRDKRGNSSLLSGAARCKTPTVLKENETIFSLILKQLLETPQATRDTQQILYVVLLIPAETMFTSTAVANTLYNKKLAKQGKGLGFLLWTAIGALAGLVMQIKAQDGRREEVSAILKTWNEMATEKAEVLRICRVEKTYANSTEKQMKS
jgi:hypothetical protein